MQRVRIGLTGLAFVFILVLIGAIFARPSNEEPAANFVDRQMNLANGVANSLPANESQPKEPLAELGLAPGNADENSATPAAARPAAR